MSNSYKFFDRKLPRTIYATINYGVEELTKCLVSEGLHLEVSDTLKLIDLYIRSIGLDKDRNKEDSNPSMYKEIRSLVSPSIQFTEFTTIEDSMIELYKNVMLDMNTHLEFQVSEDIIRNGMKYILKEMPIFLNEIVNTLIDEMTAGAGYVTRVIFAAADGDDEEKIFSMSINPLMGEHRKFGLLGIDIYSNITCSEENDTLTVIEGTFKTDEPEEIISEEKVEDNDK